MADGIVERLVLWLGTDVDAASAAKGQTFLKSMDSLAGKAAGTILGVGAAFGAMAVDAAHAGALALVASRRIGVPVETLTALRGAAEGAGTSVESLDAGLKFMARNLYAARNGNKEAIASFGKLGVHAYELKKIKIEDVMARVADKLQATTDPITRSGLAVRAFGRSGADMIPFIEKGSAKIAELKKEILDLGGVITTEQAKAGDEFESSLGRIQIITLGLTRRIGFGLLPVMTKYVDKITEAYKANRSFINQRIDKSIDLMTGSLEALSTPWGKLVAVGGLLFGSRAVFGGFLEFVGQYATVSPMAGAVVKLSGALSGLIVPAAIMALAALVAEDLWTAIQGGDSAIGRIADALGVGAPFRSNMKSLKDEMDELSKASPAIWDGIATNIEDATDRIATALQPLTDKIGEWLSGFGNILKAEFVVGSQALTRHNNKAKGFWEKYNADDAAMSGDEQRLHHQYGARMFLMGDVTDPRQGFDAYKQIRSGVRGVTSQPPARVGTTIQAPVQITIDGSRSPEITARTIQQTLDRHFKSTADAASGGVR